MKTLFTAALLGLFVTASQADAFWGWKSGGYRSGGYGYGSYYYSYPPAGYAYGTTYYTPGTVVVQSAPATSEILPAATRTTEITTSGVVQAGYTVQPGTTYVVPSGYYSPGTTYAYPGTTYYYPSSNVYLGSGRYGVTYGYSPGWNSGYYYSPGYYGGGWGSGVGIRFR